MRYADDFSIYTKSNSIARKTCNKVFLFLKDKLNLPINREKRGIHKPVQFEILGYRFVSTYEKGTKGKYQLVVSEKSWQKLKQNIKTIKRKTTPWSLAQRIHKFREVCRG
jgi:RNA-directed DNA polymerase